MVILKNLLGNLLSKADVIVDEVITSQEEKLQLKNELQKIINDHEAVIDQELTKRWEADMKSDSWLSKNIRPLTLAFLVVSSVLLIFIDAGVISFVVDEEWKDLLKMVLMTTIGAYFGGRSYEKIKK